MSTLAAFPALYVQVHKEEEGRLYRPYGSLWWRVRPVRPGAEWLSEVFKCTKFKPCQLMSPPVGAPAKSALKLYAIFPACQVFGSAPREVFDNLFDALNAYEEAPIGAFKRWYLVEYEMETPVAEGVPQGWKHSRADNYLSPNFPAIYAHHCGLEIYKPRGEVFWAKYARPLLATLNQSPSQLSIFGGKCIWY